MILFEGGFIAIGLVFFLGIFGFIAMILVMLGRGVSWLMRTVLHGAPDYVATELDVSNAPPRRCHGVNCNHVNPARAHFCARCGRRLDLPPRSSSDVDSYG